MLVCHCETVCDKEIRGCVRAGATSAAAVRDACGAGGGCGGCVPLVERLVRAELAELAAADAAGAPLFDIRLEAGAATAGGQARDHA